MNYKFFYFLFFILLILFNSCEKNRYDFSGVVKDGSFCNINTDCNDKGICIGEEHKCIYPCKDVDCSGHGECKIENNKAICDCDDGFEYNNQDKKSCINPICVNIDCSGHGECRVENNEAICDCDDGFKHNNQDKKSCINPICANVNCGHGQCKKNLNNRISCNCEKGYIQYSDKNIYCIKDPCNDVECPNGTKCELNKWKPVCKCNSENGCEELCPTNKKCENNGGCEINDNQIATCNCEEGYINVGFECVSDLCQSTENCSVNEGNGICVVEYNEDKKKVETVCICNNGYKENENKECVEN